MHGRHLEPYQRAVAAAHGDSDYVYSTGYNTSLHNVLVRMLFNLGVIGLGSYLWMWARVFITIHGGLRDAARDDPWRTDVLWGLAAGFIGLNVAGFFEDNFFDAEVQILTLILMMLAFHESQRPVRSESGAPA
jgi:O-antigen ligase